MPKLSVDAITMEFPAVRALDGVSISFEPGEVHAIVGENGAGKSTLMKILSGVQHPTAGTITLDGKEIRLHGVRDALRHGIAMIHQELNLVDELTAAENVFLGREIVRGGRLNRMAMNLEAGKYLADVQAPFAPDTKVGELSVAGKQLVEIAKALASNASILIMDEPTAVLSEVESEALFSLIRRLREKGVSVLYISHRLVEVCELADRITVLRDGKFVSTVPGKGATPADLAGLMVGRSLSEFFPPKAPQPTADPILSVENAHVEGWVHGVSFSLRPGEILGLAGLVGAGRTELAEAIFGARNLVQGVITLEGQTIKIRSPKDAARFGIAYVSEDRKGTGLVLDMSVTENVVLANLRAYCSPYYKKRLARAAAEKWQQDFDIRAGNLDAPILYLSGGNQQKVSLSKWLDLKPKVIFLDEPTRGVDVGAKREMYNLIQRLASQGMACVVISSELTEIIGLCHRAIVLREGQMMGEVGSEDLTEETLMHLAAGVEAA